MCRAVLVFAVCAALAAQPVSVSRMQADLVFLSSEPLNGRVSLQPGGDAAAEFIAAEFSKAGLKPGGDSYLQRFELIEYRSDPRHTRLALERGGQRRTFERGPDFRGRCFNDATVRAPAVFAGYGITAPEYGYDDYAGLDVRGKIVLILDHEPREKDPKSPFNGTGHTIHAGTGKKLRNAERHGAAGVLIAPEPERAHRSAFEPAPSSGRARGFAPSQTLGDIRIPHFTVSEKVADALLEPAGRRLKEVQAEIDRTLKLASRGLEDIVVEMQCGVAERRRGMTSNVIGLLEGSDATLRGETILLTSHYDHLPPVDGHWLPGANDNGSGTVAVIELARLLAMEKPRRTLVFISFGAEEEGLLGSFYYTANPVRPLTSIRAVINLDMIGRNEEHTELTKDVLAVPRDTSNELNRVGDYAYPALRAAVERANRRVGLALSDKHNRDVTQNALFRCDHLPFLMAGVPAVWFFGGWHPGYHEAADTVDKIDWRKMEKVVRLAYETVKELDR